MIVHSLLFAGTNVTPIGAFNFLGGGHYLGENLPAIISTSKLLILLYTDSSTLKGIKELII